MMIDPEAIARLKKKYGTRNVEDTLIFITGAHTPQGLSCLITPTEEMVDTVLAAVHKDVIIPGGVMLQPAV